MIPVKTAKYILIIVLLDRLPANAAIPIVVPNAAENVEGNDLGYTPFSDAFVQQTRYQQVYHASQFSAVPPRGAFISAIIFRPDCLKGNGNSTLTNAQLNLSTSLKEPDHLSQVFAENVGTNHATVLGPRTVGIGGTGGGCPSGFGFGSLLVLDTPFFYNPAQGNLLM